MRKRGDRECDSSDNGKTFMISPRLKNDGWGDEVWLRVRTLHLKVSKLLTQSYQRTKKIEEAQQAKYFYDEAMAIKIKSMPE